MKMKCCKVILIVFAIILVSAFLIFQISLSNKIHIYLQPANSVSLIQKEYEEQENEAIIPRKDNAFRGFNESQSSLLNNETELPTPIALEWNTSNIWNDELVTTKPTSTPIPSRNKTTFNPVGISFTSKRWYSSFRYYQMMKEKEFQFSTKINNNSYQVFNSTFFDFMLISTGCVDVYKRSILIINNNTHATPEKTHLRSSFFSSKRTKIEIPGFQDYQLYLVNETTIPSSIPLIDSTNSTWILTTPQEISVDECIDSFSQYIPLFYHSIYPVVPMNVFLNFNFSN